MQKERPEDYGLFRAIALNALSDTEPMSKTAWRELTLTRTPPEYFARRWEEAKTKNYSFTSSSALSVWTFAMLAQTFQKKGLITREMTGKQPGTPWKSTDEWSARLTEKGRAAKAKALSTASAAPVGSECRAVLPLRSQQKAESKAPGSIDLADVVERLEALEKTMSAIRGALLGLY
jgi:hypothetical protein